MYSGRNDGWWCYDPETSKILEENYLIPSGPKSINVSILGRTYEVVFPSKESKNEVSLGSQTLLQDGPGQSLIPIGIARKVKRVESGIMVDSILANRPDEEEMIKGIAGLKLKRTTLDVSDGNI